MPVNQSGENAIVENSGNYDDVARDQFNYKTTKIGTQTNNHSNSYTSNQTYNINYDIGMDDYRKVHFGRTLTRREHTVHRQGGSGAASTDRRISGAVSVRRLQRQTRTVSGSPSTGSTLRTLVPAQKRISTMGE